MNGLPKIFYDNRLNDAVPVASTTAAGFSVLNLRDSRPFTWWKPTAMPATVTVDCGAAKAVDSLAVYGHDLGTRAATIELRGSTDNFGASDVLVDTFAPADDLPFIRQFASVSYRYWRLRFTGAAAPSLAIAAPGVALELPRRMQRGFDPIGRVAKGQSNRSAGGHPLGRVTQYEEWSESLNFRNVSQTWLRDTFLPAWKAHLRDKPVVLAWDPVDHATELYLVTIKDKFSAAHGNGLFTDLRLDVMGVVP